MGIETDPDLGGSGSSFTSAIIAIEELAKIDPSVSVMCDVHNTLVNTVFRTYATKEQQEKFLPQLAESKVRFLRSIGFLSTVSIFHRSARSVFPSPLLGPMLSRCKPVRLLPTTGHTTPSPVPRCGLPTLPKLKYSSSLQPLTLRKDTRASPALLSRVNSA